MSSLNVSSLTIHLYLMKHTLHKSVDGLKRTIDFIFEKDKKKKYKAY